MLLIAIQMLIGDKVKYLTLISALAFSSLLMMQQSGVFWGVMRSTASILENTGAPIWVVDPQVEQVVQPLALRDTDLYRVRSIPEVEWAYPMYLGTTIVKFSQGKSVRLTIRAFDASTLLGLPLNIISGRIQDIWKSDGVFATPEALSRLNRGRKEQITVGDVLVVNDHEVRIVGIIKATYGTAFSDPELFTTYDRAIEILPSVRKNLHYILVSPKKGIPVQKAVDAIEKKTGLKAYSEEDFFWMTLRWYTKETGVPLSFFITIVLGFVVGIAVSGQTFYSFVHENLGNFAALKAMGASNLILSKMLLFQAFFASMIGFGIGIGLTVLFGYAVENVEKLPFDLNWKIIVMVFFLICIIAIGTAYTGIRKIITLEPAEVFRA